MENRNRKETATLNVAVSLFKKTSDRLRKRRQEVQEGVVEPGAPARVLIVEAEHNAVVVAGRCGAAGYGLPAMCEWAEADRSRTNGAVVVVVERYFNAVVAADGRVLRHAGEPKEVHVAGQTGAQHSLHCRAIASREVHRAIWTLEEDCAVQCGGIRQFDAKELPGRGEGRRVGEVRFLEQVAAGRCHHGDGERAIRGVGVIIRGGTIHRRGSDRESGAGGRNTDDGRAGIHEIGGRDGEVNHCAGRIVLERGDVRGQVQRWSGRVLHRYIETCIGSIACIVCGRAVHGRGADRECGARERTARQRRVGINEV